MAVTSSVARAAAALVAAPLLVLACGAPPDSGPTATTEDSLCTQPLSGNGNIRMMSLCNPGSSSGGGGGGGGSGVTYTTSCGLIAGTFASSTYALPYNTQSPPSGLTGAGWASSSQADMNTKLANMNSICASPGGILCFFAMLSYEVIHEQWQFENNFADALQAVTGVDPTQAPPLLLASGDPNAAMHNWYGVEISAAQAYDPGVRAVVNKFGVPPAQNEMNNYVVHPQIFQCTRTGSNGSSSTRYYGAWDPDCGSATCSPILKPRVSGAT